jgi:hypothetical protein
VKFSAKSTAWDENRVFLEGDNLQVDVKFGRWMLTCPPERVQHPNLLFGV